MNPKNKRIVIDNNEGKRVLITGGDGYIGSNLNLWLKKRGYEVILSVNRKTGKKNCFQADITDSRKISNLINQVKPDVIVHTAGISNLNLCEKEPEIAKKINLQGTKNIIEAINKVNSRIKLVFFSSEYVFLGDKGNRKETDDTRPKTIYGKSKLDAEKAVKEKINNFVICRTANVFGKGGNFFTFITDSLKGNKQIEVFDDTFFTPTYIDYLCDSLEKVINSDFRGIIHIAGQDRVSRYDFALKIAQSLNKDANLIKPVKQPREGLITKDSSLDISLLRKTISNYCPPLQKAIHFNFGNLISPYFYFGDDRGKILGISRLKKWKEINYIDSLKGTIRGNHYHKKTLEGFFIIKGKIKVTLMDIKSKLVKEFLVSDGDLFLVRPNTLHTFEVLKDSCWINFLSNTVDQGAKDFYRL